MSDERGPESQSSEPGHQPSVESSIIDAPTPNAEAQFVAETDAHSRHTRLGWEIIAAAIAVLLVAAGITYALWPDASPPDSPPVTPDASTPVSETPIAGLGGRGSENATPSGGGARVATPGSTDGTSGVTGAPRGSSSQKLPAGDGVPLTDLAAPPERTVSMLVVSKGFTSATYTVVFRPYGWGGGGRAGGRLVVRVVSSQPTGGGAKTLDAGLAGRNASVWCTPEVASAVAKGGTYRGVVEVRPQGDVGTLYLTDATLKE